MFAPRWIFRIFLTLSLAAGYLLVPQPASALTASTFVSTTYRWAQEEERSHGVPASVAIAQAMLESGMGESGLTKNHNNWFGIKCWSDGSPWPNGCVSVRTTEYNSSGEAYSTTASFRTYATDQDSFHDHGRFLSTRSRYAKAFNYTNNPDRFIVEVHLGGYATDPQYANKVINLMTKYNLYQYNITAPASGSATLAIRPQTQAKVGATAVVTGLVSPNGGGVSVQTQVKLASGWARSQVVTAGSRGQFTLQLTYGANQAGPQRFRVVASSRSGTLVSQEFTLTRTASISVSNLAGEPGAALHATGTINGVSTPTWVSTQVWTGSAWSTSKTGYTASDGTYRLEATYGKGHSGSWRYRIAARTSSGYALYSSEFSVRRWSAPSVSAPATSPLGIVTNVTGTTGDGTSGSSVRTQALINGRWSTSQVRTTTSGGAFSIPLTYGYATLGQTTYRVGVQRPNGTTVWTSRFTLTRTDATVSASGPSYPQLGTVYQVRGTVSEMTSGLRVQTQALVNGRWSTSQARTTGSQGSYSIPLTYGYNHIGPTRYRVRATLSNGKVVYSPTITVNRVSFSVSAPSTSPLGTLAYVTGAPGVSAGLRVETQALVNGQWSRSQVRTTQDGGSFSIPLTYGTNLRGETTYRVKLIDANGAAAYSIYFRVYRS
ncbi:MAG: glucosaminidase domain-containing protein [Arachnia sp.]